MSYELNKVNNDIPVPNPGAALSKIAVAKDCATNFQIVVLPALKVPVFCEVFVSVLHNLLVPESADSPNISWIS